MSGRPQGRRAGAIRLAHVPARRSSPLWAPLLAVAASAFGTLPAAAHLIPAQNATLHVVGARAWLVVAVPVSATSFADDDHDGLISPAELNRHQAALAAAVRKRLSVRDAKGRGELGFLWLANATTDAPRPTPAAYFVALEGVAFPEPPGQVTVRTDLFGSAPGEGAMVMRARADGGAEAGVLTRAVPEHVFFRGPAAALADFLKLGAAHIFGGTDHLLFLLTVIVAGASWRYWVSVVTSFTLAHSLTLTLAAFGILRAPAAVVEPAIAASIVLMALDNLLRPGAVGKERIAVVFACGLLHGLGFASALGEMGLDDAHRILSLAGFNLGVECGQFAFLAAVLCGFALMRRLAPRISAGGGARLASLGAAAAGGLMLVERLSPILYARA